jgi:hypothetical protein
MIFKLQEEGSYRGSNPGASGFQQQLELFDRNLYLGDKRMNHIQRS